MDISVFDALETDNTGHRVASRRALALAHTRVEAGLGRFLRAAQSEEEFFERLGLVSDEFDGFITTASQEVGHSHPEHIAAALKDHYRLAAGNKVEFVQTPAEELEEEDEDKEKTARTWPVQGGLNMLETQPQQGLQPKATPPNPVGPVQMQGHPQAPQVQPNPDQQQPHAPNAVAPYAGVSAEGQGQVAPPDFAGQMKLPDGSNPFSVMGSEGKQGSPLVPKEAGAEDAYAGHEYAVPGDNDQWSDVPTRCENCGYHGQFNGRGECPLCGHYPGDAVENIPHSRHPFMGSNEHDLVTCPECGGDGKTAGATKCPKCSGKGKVVNFGDSMVDAVGADIKTSADDHGNTDLDGPEPKMDKSLWTETKPGKPDYEDGPRHPTKEKDVTEVIGPMRNDHPLEEIHGQGTHFKEETLPTQDGDKPFADNNMESGPHTKTWGNDGQVDPVTREALSHAYLAATQRKGMGMSAQDFRMLADAIRTAPEGGDKNTLANHVAQYLQHTNPLFDANRFLQAAIGDYSTQRDVYKGPAPTDFLGGGQMGASPVPDSGIVPTSKTEDNPLVGLLESQWPSDQAVLAALLS